MDKIGFDKKNDLFAHEWGTGDKPTQLVDSHVVRLQQQSDNHRL